MKFYSEVLNKFYDTSADCTKAEDEAKKKELEAKKAAEKAAAERKSDSEAVEVAYKVMKEATENYEKVLSEFCKKHGAYHTSLTNADIDDIFRLFRIF